VKQVPKKNMKAVLAFTKLRLDEDWGPLDQLFDLVYYDPEQAKLQKKMRRQAYKLEHPAE